MEDSKLEVQSVKTSLDCSNADKGVYILNSVNLKHQLHIVFMNFNTNDETLVAITAGDNKVYVPLQKLNNQNLKGENLVPDHMSYAPLFNSMLSNGLDDVRKNIFHNNLKQFHFVVKNNKVID